MASMVARNQGGGVSVGGMVGVGNRYGVAGTSGNTAAGTVPGNNVGVASEETGGVAGIAESGINPTGRLPQASSQIVRHAAKKRNLRGWARS